MNLLAGYEGLTNKQIKDKVLTDLYLNGSVNGVYMKKHSNSKVNGLKFYISRWFKHFGVFQTMDLFIHDIYQLIFVELAKIDDDKFINTYFEDGILNVNKLCATACLMVKRKAFFKLYRENKHKGKSTYVQVISFDDYFKLQPDTEPKEAPKEGLLVVNHSYMTKFQHGSILTHGNLGVNPIENVDENAGDEHCLILYDDDSDDVFHSKYGFEPSDILNHLSPEERDLFIRNTGKSFNPDKTTQVMLALAEKIKAIKTKFDNDRKRIV
ncbi:hypothetical protein [Pedobacter aquatilis]|uniref:hypothetical protein n=1 Tax=Pedobacter aquatilis TaxID=351343 RepID=UPI002931E4DA|nr:hypothetical protein [Pedobacter aquatilis]